MSSGSKILSPNRNILDENWKSRPRQSACCPVVWSGSVGSDGESFLTKIYFSSRGRGRVPAGSDLSDIPDFDFLTKIEFSSRGLSDGSAGRYLIAWHSPILLTKIALTFARAARGGAVRNCLVWIGQPSPWLRILAFIVMHCIQNYMSFGWKYSSVQLVFALVFCGNMCAVPSVWLSISPHIKFYMPVPFLCQICPSYGYDYTHIESDFARLSYRYDNHLLDLFWIFFWIIGGRSLIDMTADRFRIDMIMTEFFLSKWLNSPIEMTATSYWYEGMERGFFTLCYLSIWASFFLSLIQKIWRSSSQKESHLYKGYDRSFWAAKILSMG